MTKEIKITSSKGNSKVPGREIFWAWVNGEMLRKRNGVGRTFRTEAAARKAAERE